MIPIVRKETVLLLSNLKDSRALKSLEDLYETEQEGKVLFAINQVLNDFK